MGNTTKTLNEKHRFLYGAINDAVGEMDIELIDEYAFVAVREAGMRHGVYGSQRSVLYFKQLLDYVESKLNVKLKFNYRKFRLPVVPERNIEYLTPSELQRVRGLFDCRTLPSLRTRTLIEFMMGTALRIGEVCSIDKKDVNFDTGEFRFTDKFGARQTMVCPPNALAWIKRYVMARRDDLPALFVSGRARMIPNASKSYMRDKIKTLGINKKICHHIFRKTCGTNLLLDTDIKSTQTFLRHKSAETTLKHYTGITDSQTREATAKITDRYIQTI